MWERDSKIFNIMLALRSARKGSLQANPVISIISDIFKKLAMPSVIRQRDFENIMNLTIAKIVDTIGAQAITTFLVENDLIRFKYIYYSPTLYDLEPEARQKFEATKNALLSRGIERGQGIVGKVIEENKTISVEDTSKDPHFLKAVDQFTGFETKSMITVPLRDMHGKAVGAIQVLNKLAPDGEVIHFTQEDVHLLEDVAEYSSKIFQKMVDPDFHLSEEDTARYIAKVAGLDFLTPSFEEIPSSIWKEFSPEEMEKFQMVPY
ncbi:MAG: GAF domain-containing protein, partial [Planctomycetota bacterium]